MFATDMDKNSSDMEDKIFDIVTDLLRDEISKTEAIDKLLNLFDVSGMFCSDKLEQAYKDGVRDALAKGYGTFNEENYR